MQLWSQVRLVMLLAVVALGTGCATRPTSLSRTASAIVAVKCARLPTSMPAYTHFAEHGWIDFKIDGDWFRVEVISRLSGVELHAIDDATARDDRRWGDRVVHVIASYEGEQAREMGKAILQVAEDYPEEEGYRAWPGPNSNTFLDWLGKQVPGLWFEQHPAALGGDYPHNGWIDFGLTTTRTGVELETPYLGVELGLADGAEVHLLGLTFGVDLWPPQIELPCLPAIPWGFFSR